MGQRSRPASRSSSAPLICLNQSRVSTLKASPSSDSRMLLVIHRRIVVALLLVAIAAKLSAQPSAIILVRHAEKAATPASDPGLTPVGLQRAADLAAALGDAHVNAIVTTQLERAKATAKPLADAAKIVPTIVPTSSDLAAHVNAVVAAVA